MHAVVSYRTFLGKPREVPLVFLESLSEHPCSCWARLLSSRAWIARAPRRREARKRERVAIMKWLDAEVVPVIPQLSPMGSLEYVPDEPPDEFEVMLRALGIDPGEAEEFAG